MNNCDQLEDELEEADATYFRLKVSLQNAELEGEMDDDELDILRYKFRKAKLLREDIFYALDECDY